MFLKKIIDVKISNKEISVTRDAKISIIELEDQIKKLDYSGEKKPKDPIVENAKIPPFIQSFYYLFFKNLKVPTEKEFCEAYLELVGGNIGGNIFFDGLMLNTDGVLNRMKRTYPSLVRDLHFLYLLEESRNFDLVQYSMQMDYINGLDLKISYKGNLFFVSLFIDSTRGKYFKGLKKERHDYSQTVEIEFNVDFSSMKKVGNIYLLNKSHIELLIERINSIN